MIIMYSGFLEFNAVSWKMERIIIYSFLDSHSHRGCVHRTSLGNSSVVFIPFLYTGLAHAERRKQLYIERHGNAANRLFLPLACSLDNGTPPGRSHVCPTHIERGNPL